jgi:hypothetical protein
LGIVIRNLSKGFRWGDLNRDTPFSGSNSTTAFGPEEHLSTNQKQ